MKGLAVLWFPLKGKHHWGNLLLNAPGTITQLCTLPHGRHSLTSDYSFSQTRGQNSIYQRTILFWLLLSHEERRHLPVQWIRSEWVNSSKIFKWMNPCIHFGVCWCLVEDIQKLKTFKLPFSLKVFAIQAALSSWKPAEWQSTSSQVPVTAVTPSPLLLGVSAFYCTLTCWLNYRGWPGDGTSLTKYI